MGGDGDEAIPWCRASLLGIDVDHCWMEFLHGT